ncbi:hypothetical protein ACA910_009637 [Epithemia clementina (nom. ined.)]
MAELSLEQLLQASMECLSSEDDQLLLKDELMLSAPFSIPRPCHMRGDHAFNGYPKPGRDSLMQASRKIIQHFQETRAPNPSPIFGSPQFESPQSTNKACESCNFLEDLPMTSSSDEIPLAAVLVETLDLFSACCSNASTSSTTSSTKKRPVSVLEEANATMFSLEEEQDNDVERRGNTRRRTGQRTCSTSPAGCMTQDDQWNEKFQELKKYREEHGNCSVPHNYKYNLALARWVKRQRHQMKQIMEQQQEDGRPVVLSKIMEERAKALEEIGFVWDCQGTNWEEKLLELQEYRTKYQDCNVPSNYSENPKLGMWVKCQRRQYKLYKEGKQSSMTTERIQGLESIGFNWGLRNYKKKKL